MKLLLILALISLLLGHSIKEKNRPYDNALQDFAWLQQLTKETSPGTCNTEIRESVYQEQPAFESRETDPWCNGVNTVYRCDGSILLTSADHSAYEDYLLEATGTKIIWTSVKSIQ